MKGSLLIHQAFDNLLLYALKYARQREKVQVINALTATYRVARSANDERQ